MVFSVFKTLIKDITKNWRDRAGWQFSNGFNTCRKTSRYNCQNIVEYSFPGSFETIIVRKLRKSSIKIGLLEEYKDKYFPLSSKPEVKLEVKTG